MSSPRAWTAFGRTAAMGLIGTLLFGLVTLLALPGSSASAATTAQAGGGTTSSTAGPVGGLWLAIGASPSATQISQYAGRYGVIVLNSWDHAALAQIRTVNPAAKVLVYQDLASTRSYTGAVVNGQDARDLPTGVGYVEAQAHPDWFAADTSGNRIEWTPYPSHWQMAVWNAAYQQRWAGEVTARAVNDGWDGVYADNDMRTLGFYSSAILAGTSTHAETDAQIRVGLAALVATAGAQLRTAGKVLVPNISDGRLDLSRWSADSQYGGGGDENFVHWGTAADSGFVTDWSGTGWQAQTSELQSPLTLLVTRAAASDTATMRYGYGSALVRAAGPVFWMPSTAGNYTVPEWFAWQSTAVGTPSAPGQRLANGVWTRAFSGAFVAVNPTTSPQTVSVPSTYGGGVVTLAAHDATLAAVKTSPVKHVSNCRSCSTNLTQSMLGFASSGYVRLRFLAR
jgi:Hypothetical glycosyl hydrolase family 15